jgi:hypothetical protein
MIHPEAVKYKGKDVQTIQNWRSLTLLCQRVASNGCVMISASTGLQDDAASPELFGPVSAHRAESQERKAVGGGTNHSSMEALKSCRIDSVISSTSSFAASM